MHAVIFFEKQRANTHTNVHISIVNSLFTNVPLQETIGILVDKAFIDNWFNTTHNLYISKQDLEVLLKVATMD